MGQQVTKKSGEKRRSLSHCSVAPFALPTLESTAGQVDDAKRQQDYDDERPTANANCRSSVLKSHFFQHRPYQRRPPDVNTSASD